MDDAKKGHDAPLPRAWSFPVHSTAELSRRLTAAGAGATLAVFPYEADGLLRLHLRVVSPNESVAVDAEPDINESFPCPPFTGCPGGG